jgi:hypothetical protein
VTLRAWVVNTRGFSWNPTRGRPVCVDPSPYVSGAREVVIGVGRVLAEETTTRPGQRTWIDGLVMAMHRTERGRARGTVSTGRGERAKEARRGAAGRHAERRVDGRRVLWRRDVRQADAAKGGGARA